MSLIFVEGLSFSYESCYDPIFKNVSFQMDTHWKLGFTGRNGRGKTTFLRLLMGDYDYEGRISTSVGFDYFPFSIANPALLVHQVMSQICPDAESWQIQRELSLLEVDEDLLSRIFSTLSHGEQTKILLAGLFLKENRFLLLDEPTNHLDQKARGQVLKYLKKKKGFILVSHDRVFLDQCVDHILSINKTSIEIQRGNFSSWLHNKALQDQFELAENEKLKKDIDRLTASSRRTALWSNQVERSKIGSGPVDRGYIGHKAAKMMKRSKVIEARQNKAIEDKSKLLKNIEYAEPLHLRPLSYDAETLIEASNLTLSYGPVTACHTPHFVVRRGERIALAGKNGSGKSTLLKFLLGETIAHQGLLRLGSRLVISYVPQDTSVLRGKLSDYALTKGIELHLLFTMLRKLDFSELQLEKDMSDFSEGQKKKVLLAGSLCQQAHLYIWDEPLNFIDVLSKMQIEQLILTYQPTLLFVEHDITFVENIATRVVTL